MEHTKGEVKIKETTEASEKITYIGTSPENSLGCFDIIAKIYPSAIGGTQEANANRIAALWNAANGMSTEEAVSLLNGTHLEE